MKALYIAWQDPQSRSWHTVGKLTKQKDMYCFSYTRGALASPRFNYLGRMFDLRKQYYSRELFPLFANRVLNSSRPEYADYLRWLALDSCDSSSDVMELLARSGGKRATDELDVYPHPEPNEQGEIELFFLSHGLRYLEPSQLVRVNNLQEGENLLLRREKNNAHDHFALLLETEEIIKVGYCPRYLSRDLSQIMEKTTINLVVARLNKDAPTQFRLLCRATFKVPNGFDLFTDNEYLSLNEDEVAA